MADWHATVYLVPHERVSDLDADGFSPPFEPAYVESLPADLGPDADWWTRRQPPPDFRTSLDRLLPRLPSWAQDLELWGSEEGDRIDVRSEAGQVVELRARFDLRSPNAVFITGLAEWAADLQADFLDEHNMLYEASSVGLAVALRNSTALRFVDDPLGFLARVRGDARPG